MLLLALAALLTVTGCGGGGSPVVKGPLGAGADRVWIVRPEGKPKSVVVFVHGLAGKREITPANHVPWLKHLAEQGNAVIYPAYEVDPGGPRAVAHIVAGVKNGLAELGNPDVPVIGIGYSRGGRLVVEWAALEQPAPRAVLSVFPSQINPVMEPAIDLGKLDPRIQLRLLVGDSDQAVGNGGAAEMIDRLHHFGFPQENISAGIVHSTANLTADHFAPLDSGPDARAAFWDPADAMIDAARTR